ncbi:MAG TPA: class I SAM-dependent methyltransferase, partial [Cellvibrionaceae bacterium]
QLLEANIAFYDPLWAEARLIGPERFNTWPLVEEIARNAPSRLEIGPGLRPRLPIAGTHFVDISAPALATLNQAGGNTCSASISQLPYPDGHFDLICALDIVEHVDDDLGALGEISRVAKTGATILLSVPLHPEYWTAFDDFVGHRRRYEPKRLAELLQAHGFALEQSAVFGMKPKSSKLTDLGMWFLIHRRERALWWYNRVFMPMGLRFQKPLNPQAGMVPTEGVDDVFLVCRKLAQAASV